MKEQSPAKAAFRGWPVPWPKKGTRLAPSAPGTYAHALCALNFYENNPQFSTGLASFYPNNLTSIELANCLLCFHEVVRFSWASPLHAARV